MRDEIHVRLADQVDRTRQREQRRAGQIADVEKSELAELHAHGGRTRVLRLLLRRNPLPAHAAFVWPAPASGFDESELLLATTMRVDAVERQAIARLRLDVLPFRAHARRTRRRRACVPGTAASASGFGAE